MNTTNPANTPSQWGNIETLPEHELLIVAQHTTHEGKKARAFIQQRDARSSAEREGTTLEVARAANKIATRSVTISRIGAGIATLSLIVTVLQARFC